MKAPRNYQRELEKIIDGLDAPDAAPPRLLLHSCCAPCSSYCMEYLRQFFQLTVFYYNPNITEKEEYRKRAKEEIRLIGEYNRRAQQEAAHRQDGVAGQAEEWTGPAGKNVRNETAGEQRTKTKGPCRIEVIEGDYEPERFLEAAKGLESCAEGGERCFRCYELRLRKSAELAKKMKFDYFTTTLTISPLKNAAKLNEIGEGLAEEYGVAWLPSDFKKRGGYQRSIELSKEYDLYRQNYCGCVFSRREAEKRKS